MVLSETGLPNRVYLPREDVAAELVPSETTTICPYKGEASHWSLAAGGATFEDAAFSYPEPLDDAIRVGGYVCFVHDGVATALDG
jgi:uncharacterized protein (DUF427 family)